MENNSLIYRCNKKIKCEQIYIFLHIGVHIKIAAYPELSLPEKIQNPNYLLP